MDFCATLLLHFSWTKCSDTNTKSCGHELQCSYIVSQISIMVDRLADFNENWTWKFLNSLLNVYLAWAWILKCPLTGAATTESLIIKHAITFQTCYHLYLLWDDNLQVDVNEVSILVPVDCAFDKSLGSASVGDGRVIKGEEGRKRRWRGGEGTWDRGEDVYFCVLEDGNRLMRLFFWSSPSRCLHSDENPSIIISTCRLLGYHCDNCGITVHPEKASTSYAW